MRFCGWEMPVESVDKEVIAAWVEALTAEADNLPKYQQGVGALERHYIEGKQNCCLGVLCRVLMERAPGVLVEGARRGYTLVFEGEFDPDGTSAHASSSVLPYAAQKVAGFITSGGTTSYANETPDGRFENPPFIMRDRYGKLRPVNATQANDTQLLTFAEIAEGLTRTYLEPWTDEIKQANDEYAQMWEELGIPDETSAE